MGQMKKDYIIVWLTGYDLISSIYSHIGGRKQFIVTTLTLWNYVYIVMLYVAMLLASYRHKKIF